MSDFKEFSKKTTQNQNDSNAQPNEDKTEKPVQSPEEVNNPKENNNEEKKE
ncbi:hypothetical protein SAMN02799632_04047 [Acinetobacter pittii]|uniref:hypothetical protein n=1 Tax=Acinetobacter TaxID=469 RepID=UPI00044AC70C|nr:MULTISPECIES: hypothetical protein [Acinetobacter]EXE80814.1 hypothetical protein J588_3901 [Acinetobacter sp. 1578804]KCX13498.1 hypothetical protein J723_3910 [Acinetobacter sp. 1264765]MBJ8487819.1 hypothetical protein [Acinetobacter pittii]MBS5201659.1 hypothetical protein [Acinetobacter sp.]MCH2054985.1 hypothetical protein [Acinetobacter pittii]